MADVDGARMFVDDRHPEDRWLVFPDGRVLFALAGGEPVSAIMTVRDVTGNHWLREVNSSNT